MPAWPWGLLLTAGTLFAALSPGPPAPADPCHDEGGAPRGCVPGLVNAALGREVLASSTCGRPATRACDASDPRRAHPPALLTSPGGTASPLCWRSEWLPRAPLNVTLTVPLGKAFELVFVSLRFCSAPPASVALLKSQDHGRSWAPLGFFSSHCDLDYGRLPAPADGPAGPGPEALCFPAPQAQPDGSGLLAFSVQDSSPPGLDLDSSPVLQDWVTATDIRVVLTRPSAAGDPRDMEAVVPYSYAATDLQVGGRCKCNGHASRCLLDTQGHLICDCRHGTEGPDCGRCKPFYCDRPWQRATARESHACLACSCNGHARRCRFNMELYRLSGRRSGAAADRQRACPEPGRPEARGGSGVGTGRELGGGGAQRARARKGRRGELRRKRRAESTRAGGENVGSRLRAPFEAGIPSHARVGGSGARRCSCGLAYGRGRRSQTPWARGPIPARSLARDSARGMVSSGRVTVSLFPWGVFRLRRVGNPLRGSAKGCLKANWVVWRCKWTVRLVAVVVKPVSLSFSSSLFQKGGVSLPFQGDRSTSG
ncbi:hypothetical protein H8958_002413 [Nasalis larvatus]